MRFFTGQYERTIDAKNRIQIPAPLRAAIQPERDGSGLYVTLGDYPGTLSIYHERGLDERAARADMERVRGDGPRVFNLQFYAVATFVEMDVQGRVVLPARLRRKARLGEEIYLVGQKHCIDVWNRADFDRSLGIDWEGDEWPDWPGYTRGGPDELEAGHGGGQA